MKQLVILPILFLTQFSCSDESNYRNLETEIPELDGHSHYGNLGIDMDVLEQIDPYPREVQALLVPPNTVNLAKGRSVTASVGPSDITIGSLERLTDGNKGRGESDFTELISRRPGGAVWTQVDLGRPCTLQGVWLWRYWGSPTTPIIYRDTVVQIANDPTFTIDVKTIFNSDFDNSMGLGVGHDKAFYETRFGRLFPCNGVTGRFVRVHSSGRMRSKPEAFIEIEVHGAPLHPTKGEQDMGLDAG